jgi:ABC-2 type transport system ATP-binding protein
MAETRAAGASEVPIEAKGLTKSYRGRPAVAGIDLTVLPGEVYGFLGPNGAGKTTTMRMLLGLVRPDAGSVRLCSPLAPGWRGSSRSRASTPT